MHLCMPINIKNKTLNSKLTSLRKQVERGAEEGKCLCTGVCFIYVCVLCSQVGICLNISVPKTQCQQSQYSRLSASQRQLLHHENPW